MKQLYAFLDQTNKLVPGFRQGGRKQIFYGGATVNSKNFFSQIPKNLLNKTPKDGGAIAPPAPPAPPPLADTDMV